MKDLILLLAVGCLMMGCNVCFRLIASGPPMEDTLFAWWAETVGGFLLGGIVFLFVSTTTETRPFRDDANEEKIQTRVGKEEDSQAGDSDRGSSSQIGPKVSCMSHRETREKDVEDSSSSLSCVSKRLDDEEDPLTAFRQFLSQDKAKLSLRQKQYRDKRKDKTPSSKDKNGTCRTALPSNLQLPSSISHNNKPIATDGASQTFRKVSSGSKEFSSSSTTRKRKVRSVRFADEDGNDIQIVHEMPNGEDDALYSLKRVLVLLMLPQKQVFEFVGLEYNTDTTVDPLSVEDKKENEETVRISQILQQLPSLASDPTMAKQRFVRLMRLDSSNNREGTATRELIKALPIQSYDLNHDEVLVAVPKGSSPQQIMESSERVLQNKKLMRALRRNQGFGTSFP